MSDKPGSGRVTLVGTPKTMREKAHAAVIAWVESVPAHLKPTTHMQFGYTQGYEAGHDARELEVEALRKELALYQVPEEEPGLGPSDTSRGALVRQWQRAEAAEARVVELEDMLQDADTALHAENAALRAKVTEQADALDEDIQRARESRGPARGMTVPNLGRFCSATPSVLRDLTQLARDLRTVIAGKP